MGAAIASLAVAAGAVVATGGAAQAATGQVCKSGTAPAGSGAHGWNMQACLNFANPYERGEISTWNTDSSYTDVRIHYTLTNQCTGAQLESNSFLSPPNWNWNTNWYYDTNFCAFDFHAWLTESGNDYVDFHVVY
jgi:hypothetical protein